MDTFRHLNSRSRGFTIVELLIVIVVIGILAAITIVAFNGVRQRATVATLQSDLESANKQLQLYQVENSAYPTGLDCSSPAATNTICLKSSSNTTYTAYIPNNALSPPMFCLTATNGTTNYSSTPNGSPASGTCVINLITNPNSQGGVGTNQTGAGTGLTTASGLPLPGGYGFKVTPVASNDSYFGFGDNASGTFRLGLQPGHTYTVSGYIYLPAAQTSSNLRPSRARGISFFSTSPSGVEFDSTQAPNASGVTRVNLTFTIPTTATNGFIRFYNGSDTASDVVYWSDLMLTEGSTLYAYADGGSSGWSWTGAVNTSTSMGPQS